MSAPIILAFDTSAAYCGAALLSGDQIIAARHDEMAKGQAEHLFALLEDVLNSAGAGWRELTALAVGIGPGNFTGIRISVSSARGLALSLGVPAHGVSNLEALSQGTAGPVLACLDARRESVFVQGFGGAEPLHAAHMDVGALPAALSCANLKCVGSGADMVAQAIGAKVYPAALAPAAAIARIAARRNSGDVPRPAPLYLRAADAKPSSTPPPAILP